MKLGIISLLQSRKATLCLLILGCSTVALFTSHMDGTAYAMVVGTIGSIYCFTQHRVDIAQMQTPIGTP